MIYTMYLWFPVHSLASLIYDTSINQRVVAFPFFCCCNHLFSNKHNRFQPPCLFLFAFLALEVVGTHTHTHLESTRRAWSLFLLLPTTCVVSANGTACIGIICTLRKGREMWSTLRRIYEYPPIACFLVILLFLP